jgi:hypothetical protein
MLYVVSDDLDREYTLKELCDHVYNLCGKKPYSEEECTTYLNEIGLKLYTIE